MIVIDNSDERYDECEGECDNDNDDDDGYDDDGDDGRLQFESRSNGEEMKHE